MKLPSEAELLRIFVGESDKHDGRPLYESIGYRDFENKLDQLFARKPN